MPLTQVTNFTLAYTVATILFLLLSCFIILFLLIYQKRRNLHFKEMLLLKQTYENQLLQSQIEVQESTYNALAKELHDNIGQLLSTAKMLLGITERNIIKPPDTLLTANETVGQAINELRSLSKSLSKEWLEQFDLISNLRNEINRINAAEIIKVHYTCDDKLSIKPETQIIVFRIIQEAIQNSIKHANAANIYITIKENDNLLSTSVTDDGQGFNAEKNTEGLGIKNMKQRAHLLNGTINSKNNNNGCSIIFTMPLTPDVSYLQL